ncbi:hypothetical protein GCM10025857_54230 [Alicyclobacillus contaminans]|uniref:Uncharacterized protein n=1 Tax=Tetragenococcus osmophilus TaxID=526944 RepID=A0AA37XJD8_9ENTE|nr:hypothetical protein [Tetragenococcus osmophilus]GMA54066.1 hypothetical protein GCM10025857_54230 [Alicyclobacillus contaminans]GMA72043.1 hypothetical protein GCM10025885_10920 [Tetragenococcus osmophilus]
MSISHYTKEILDILDLNLTFAEDCFQKEVINGVIKKLGHWITKNDIGGLVFEII